MMALVIAGREFRNLFLSPLAWTMLGVLQFILGFMFLAQLDYYLVLQPRFAGLSDVPGVTDAVVAPLFGNAGVILMLVTPLLTMRLVSEERRNRTLSLLFTAPVSMTEIILGKYLGVIAFLFVIIGMLSLMPASLYLGGMLDTGKILSNLLALVLLVSAYAAVGLYMSTLSTHPTVAAISSFGAILVLWILDWSSQSDEKVGGVLQYLSMLRHYESMLRGLVSTTDICYFVLFISLFLVLSIQRLDSDRLQQ
jgi:ABC-2 type transport system permease protein